jgi:predicted HicB family RNase H-like nuclease
MPKTKPKKVSGPSGANTQAGVLVRESEPGQIDAWRAEAERKKLSLSEWIRRTLNKSITSH